MFVCQDTHVPELVDDGDLLLRDIPPPRGEPRPCKEGRRPYEADFVTLHSAERIAADTYQSVICWTDGNYEGADKKKEASFKTKCT